MQTAVALVVGLLTKRQYDVLEQMTRGVRLSAGDLEQAVQDYGRSIVALPTEVLDTLDPIEVTGTDLRRFHVDVDLWTQEEGRSDLTLELELVDRYSGAFDISILDLHVQ